MENEKLFKTYKRVPIPKYKLKKLWLNKLLSKVDLCIPG